MRAWKRNSRPSKTSSTHRARVEDLARARPPVEVLGAAAADAQRRPARSGGADALRRPGDPIAGLSERIRAAAARKTPLRIRGGGTKDFYGEPCAGEILDTRPLAGIVDYEPTELVITAGAGTPLADIEAAIRARGQMLAFEPPHFGAGATLGGCVAAGLSGPRRASAGAVRDISCSGCASSTAAATP